MHEQNYQNFLTQLGYKRKPKALSVQKYDNHLTISIHTGDSIMFKSDGTWLITVNNKGLLSKYPLGINSVKDHFKANLNADK